MPSFSIFSTIGCSIIVLLELDYLKVFEKIGSIFQIIKGNKALFGAYPAGLIDGDGCIKIKNNIKDRVIPQCVVKIASGRPLEDVKNLIEFHINYKVHFEFKNIGKGVNTCFYVSKKNIEFFKNYIYPNMVMPYKLSKLEHFFQLSRKTGLQGFEPRFRLLS